MFFALSKILWTVFVPSTFLVILTLAALVLSLSRYSSKCRPLYAFLLIIYLGVFVFPLGDWVLSKWERQITAQEIPEKIDGIIVLGGTVDNALSHQHPTIALNDAAERLTVVQHLIQQYPKVKIIFTGGSGSLRNQTYREADTVKKLFDEWGVQTSRMIYERDSRNTFENAIFSKKLVGPGVNENWLLVTSAAHMPRAIGVFHKAEWPVIPYLVDYRALIHPPLWCFCVVGNFEKLDQFAYEFTGTLMYRLTDKL